MLDLVHKSCSVVSSKRMQQWAASDAYQAGASSMSIFFDELCLAIRGRSLPESVKAWILDRFAGTLENEYLGDLETQDTFLSSSSKSNSNDP